MADGDHIEMLRARSARYLKRIRELQGVMKRCADKLETRGNDEPRAVADVPSDRVEPLHRQSMRDGMASYTDRDAALAVECPKCYADPGQPCCSEEGDKTERVHDERIGDLKEFISQGVGAYEGEGINP